MTDCNIFSTLTKTQRRCRNVGLFHLDYLNKRKLEHITENLFFPFGDIFSTKQEKCSKVEFLFGGLFISKLENFISVICRNLLIKIKHNVNKSDSYVQKIYSFVRKNSSKTTFSSRDCLLKFSKFSEDFVTEEVSCSESPTFSQFTTFIQKKY